MQGEGVNSSSLNPAINYSFIFIQRIDQIIKVNLFYGKFIIFLHFLIELSFHRIVILNFLVISACCQSLTVSIEIFIFLLDSAFLSSERVFLRLGHLLKTIFY